ncbi:hypothetical protein BC567DRAFT_18922 [Phyllosticta citribraziliensis]
MAAPRKPRRWPTDGRKGGSQDGDAHCERAYGQIDVCQCWSASSVLSNGRKGEQETERNLLSMWLAGWLNISRRDVRPRPPPLSFAPHHSTPSPHCLPHTAINPTTAVEAPVPPFVDRLYPLINPSVIPQSSVGRSPWCLLACSQSSVHRLRCKQVETGKKQTDPPAGCPSSTHWQSGATHCSTR